MKTFSQPLKERSHIDSLFMSIFEELPAPCLLCTPDDPASFIQFVNQAFCAFSGYSQDELLGQSFFYLLGSKPDRRALNKIHQSLQNGRERKLSLLLPRKNDTFCWTTITLTPIKNEVQEIIVFLCLFQDKTPEINTKKKLQQSKEQASLKYVESLHRTKNQIQACINLIEYQRTQSTIPAVKEALSVLSSRLYATSTAYNQIFENRRPYEKLELTNYIEDLCKIIGQLWDPLENIDVTIKGEPVYCTKERAIDIGMLLNELIVNSYKYAINDKIPDGKLSIKVLLQNKHLVLTVQDNGPGFSKNSKPQGSGFGSRLIGILLQQLQGEIRYEAHEGSRVIITLPAREEEYHAQQRSDS